MPSEKDQPTSFERLSAALEKSAAAQRTALIAESSARKVLVTTRKTPLAAANYLGDYEALIIEPTWASLTGVEALPAPGRSMDLDEPSLLGIAAMLQARSEELTKFLFSGGLLVVKVQALSGLYAKNQITGQVTAKCDTVDWIAQAVTPMMFAKKLGHWPFSAGSGTQIEIREPGHPLEELIRNARGYTALLSPSLLDFEDSVLLAVGRIGDPVAVEIAIGSGSVFLLPSGIDDSKLKTVLRELLDTQERLRSDWLLPEEAALVEQERSLLNETRRRREDLKIRQHAFAELRSSVLKKRDVKRAIDYYNAGTAATRPIKQAMVDLYKLVEILEGYFGISEEQLAAGLGVPKARFKNIKKLANQKELDFRHATSGETVGADVAEVEQAREDARFLVQKFIQHCCAEENRNSAAIPPPTR